MKQERRIGGRFINSGSGVVEVTNFLESSIVPGYIYFVPRRYVESVLEEFGITDLNDPEVKTDRGPTFVSSLKNLINIVDSKELLRMIPYKGDTHDACDHCTLKDVLGLCQIAECGGFRQGDTNYYIVETVK